MESKYKYTATGHKVRVIGQVNGDFVGFLQMEYLYGDEDVKGDGELVLLTPVEVYDEPPTAVLNERIAKMQQTIETMDEAIVRNRRTLAEQEREREFHKRWRQEHQAWFDFRGLMEGRLTHTATYRGQWGDWSIKPIKEGYSSDTIVLQAKRKGDKWEWHWSRIRRDYREYIEFFESEDSAKEWVAQQLERLNSKDIDLRRATEIVKKAREDGIVYPAWLDKFRETELAEKRKAEAEELKRRLAQLEQS